MLNEIKIMKKAGKIFLIITLNVIICLMLYKFLGFLLSKEYLDIIDTYKFNSICSVVTEEESELPGPKFKQLEFNDESFSKYCGDDRRVFEKDKTKPPIIVFGCSYAYGHGLKKEESFSYLLSEITGRTIYNYAECGGHFYASLQEFSNDVKNKEREDNETAKYIKTADYIVYVYMYDHINRFADSIYWQSSAVDEYIWKYKTAYKILGKIKKYYVYKGFPDSKNGEKYLKKMMSEGIQKTKKIAPEAQIIVLIYDEKIPLYSTEKCTLEENRVRYLSDIKNSEVWKELEEEEGIKVIHSKELTGFVFDKNYKLE